MSTQRTYTADPAAARQANANNYIDQTGKYIGEFVLAEAVTSKKGTEGIEFSFRNKEGQQANYLTLWTYNEKGEPLYGFKVLSAVMTVMGVKQIEGKQETLTLADGTKRPATVFPDLQKKPIGLVLQKEFYTKNDGGEGYKFNIFAPFQASSELTAKELLDGAAQPKALAGMISTLKDKDARTGRQASTTNQSSSSTADDPFGDDLGAGF